MNILVFCILLYMGFDGVLYILIKPKLKLVFVYEPFAAEITEDADPKVVVKRTPCQELYIRGCKFLDVIPVSIFMRHLEKEKISLRHHYLGPDGTKACCMALLVRKDLDIVDINK